jgi:hypothetical protein
MMEKTKIANTKSPLKPTYARQPGQSLDEQIPKLKFKQLQWILIPALFYMVVITALITYFWKMPRQQSTQHQIPMEEIKNVENFKLAKAIYGKKYLCIYLSSADKWASAPAIILNALIDIVCVNGANKDQNILSIWDNIDKAIDSPYEEMNKRFLGEIYQSFPMYNNLTFICAVSSVGGKTFEPFSKSAVAPHLMHLVD